MASIIKRGRCRRPGRCAACLRVELRHTMRGTGREGPRARPGAKPHDSRAPFRGTGGPEV